MNETRALRYNYYIYRWDPIVKYIDNAYMSYLNDESKVNRKNIDDHRVHACLYFINPVSRGYHFFLAFVCLWVQNVCPQIKTG